jgi:hypothetical protein
MNTLEAGDRIAFNGVKEAAAATGLRPHHIRQMLKSGELASYGVSRFTVIIKDELLAAIQRRAKPKSSRRIYNEEAAHA